MDEQKTTNHLPDLRQIKIHIDTIKHALLTEQARLDRRHSDIIALLRLIADGVAPPVTTPQPRRRSPQNTPSDPCDTLAAALRRIDHRVDQLEARIDQAAI